VTLSEALVDDLTLLSDALDDPVADLYAVLSVLTDDLTAAIPLYLGLTVALQVDGNPVTFSTLETEPAEEVRSSVCLTLQPLEEKGATGNFAFYSGAIGALADLADDARWIFNLDGYPVLDQHLGLPTTIATQAGIVGLADLRDINQAIGALIEDGRTPNQAKEHLRRLAVRDGQTRARAARVLLDAITRDPDVATEH